MILNWQKIQSSFRLNDCFYYIYKSGRSYCYNTETKKNVRISNKDFEMFYNQRYNY